MSTSWSEMILRYIDDGYTNEEIIGYFNHPAVNDEYINTVVGNRRKMITGRIRTACKPTTAVPPIGSKARRVHDFAMAQGGLKQFLELLKTRTQLSIAQELELPRHIVYNYVRDHIYGYKLPPWLKGHRSLTMLKKAEAIQKGTYKPKRKRIPIKDVRNLW